MADNTPIINILTYRLPFVLANQIYNEFHSRLKEARFLIANYKTYQVLEQDIKTVELLLSLSIFHRRVVTNFDGAIKFYGTVAKKAKVEIVKIGGYELSSQERNKLLAVIINYNQLLAKFSIPLSVMEYYQTREFLRKVISLKIHLVDNGKKENNDNGAERGDIEDLPF